MLQRWGTQYCKVICTDLNHETAALSDVFCNPFTRPEQEEGSGMDQCTNSGWQFGSWSKVQLL